jgi:hypothetical protein
LHLNLVATGTGTDMASTTETDQVTKDLWGPPSTGCPTAELNHVVVAAAEGVEVFCSVMAAAVVGVVGIVAAAGEAHSSDRT